MRKNVNAFCAILLLIALVCSTYGCKEDEKTEPLMSAKIDGVAWETSPVAGVLKIDTGADLKTMNIKRPFANNKLIELEIDEASSSGKGITVGTYNISSFSTTINLAEVLSSGATVNYLPASSGTVIVSKCDENAKTISGSFNGKIVNGTRTINITEGVFTDVSYTIK